MDLRAEKLAKARKKLKDHQEKKTIINQKCEGSEQIDQCMLLQKSLNETTKSTADNLSNEQSTVNGEDAYCNQNERESDVRVNTNVTEILISNRTNLEMQINELNGKLSHLEHLHGLEINNHNIAKQKIITLQSEVTDLTKKYSITLQEATDKDEAIKQLNNLNQSLKDKNNNLTEQLEFTKSMLTSKEFENSQLHNQVFTYKNQLGSLQLQIQQLTNDSPVNIKQDGNNLVESDALLKKILGLEHKVETLQKERDQLQSHYEHYVHELNEQLKSEINKNENLTKDIQALYVRESTLVDQISHMELRLQNYDVRNKAESRKQDMESELQKDYQQIKRQLEETNRKYNKLKMQYVESNEQIQALLQEKDTCNENICNHDNVDITKLSADITSDKLAAQRATEQNKKLKLDIEGLEQVIVKMGKDKLELTEKWTHEKQLNKGLALKLAEVEESFKKMQNQLKAKDSEMIRLQNEYRIVEHKYEKAVQELDQIKSSLNVTHNHELPCEENHNNQLDNNMEHTDPDQKSQMILPISTGVKINSLDDTRIQKEEAMVKLQERFLNIMDEVANLSDEKHRLEHIILQLQNETDTICEYVALYQQQRSLLKRREEERSNQLKIFQAECDKLKRHLEELSDVLLRLASDEQLAFYLKEESRHNDLARIKELLQKLQNCSLINPKFKKLDLNVFYPCSCCSGQLIDI